jgi:hypothetical protein
MALAAVLHLHGVPTLVIEHPDNEPELEQFIQGEREKTANSIVRWIPCPQKDHMEHGKKELRSNSESVLQEIIYNASEPVIIIDVSSPYCTDELIRMASHVLLVADAYPSKVTESYAHNIRMSVEKWLESGSSIHIVRNRDISFPHSKQWVRSLIQSADVVIPNVKYDVMVQCLWAGQIAQLHAGVDTLLVDAFQPLLKRLMPELNSIERHRTGKMPFFRRKHKLFNKKY